MNRNIYLWILRIIPSLILLQTLFFKFTGAPESVYIFSTLGVEPWGRILSGIVELIAAILILIPRWSGTGSLMAVGVMLGAILAHLTKLGIEVQGDGGLLFGMALIVLITTGILTYIERSKIPVLNKITK